MLKVVSLFLSLLLVLTGSADQIKQLIVVSRHGIRAPSKPLPFTNRPNKDDRVCPLNSLNSRVTDIGHGQNYQLGVILKQQYPELFTVTKDGVTSSNYDWKRHIFYSMDVDKDLMSGNSVAEGLFSDSYFTPKTIGSGDNAFSFHQSIPVRFTPSHVLDAESSESSCKTVIDDIIKQIASNNTAYKTLDNDFTPCYAGIMEEAGTSQPQPLKLTSSPRYAEQNILTTGHLNIMNSYKLDTVNGFPKAKIEQCLYPTEKKCKVTLSDGTQWDETYTDTIIHLATRRQQFMSDKQYRDMAKLRTTPFIIEVVKQIKNYVELNQNAQSADWYSFIFYLGENGNVQNLMQLFNQFTPGRVPFGSSVAFELHYKGATETTEALTNPDNYGLKIKYRRMSNTTFEIQNVVYNEKGEERDCKADESECKDYIDWTNAICGKDFCTTNDLLSMVYTMDEWRSRCITDKNADAQYLSDELEESQKSQSSLQSELSDTEDDKKKYQTLFIVFLVVLLVLLVIAICIIILQCCGCIGGSSSSKSSSSESNDQPMESI